MKCILIIPAYNEEGNIFKVCSDLENKGIEYIVINDGSSDNTEEVLINNNFKHITLINNLGIGGAVQTGYIFAKQNNYDYAIQFDGDGQHDSDYIFNLLNTIKKNSNIGMVIGSRFIGNQSKFKSSFSRRLGIKFLSKLILCFTKTKIYDVTSGFRIVNKAIIDNFSEEYPYDYPEPETIVSVIKLGYKVQECPVSMNERVSGESSINSLRSLYYMVKVSISIIYRGLIFRRNK